MYITKGKMCRKTHKKEKIKAKMFVSFIHYFHSANFVIRYSSSVLIVEF